MLFTSLFTSTGAIKNPYCSLGSSLCDSPGTAPGYKIFELLGIFFKMAIVVASLYALWNFLLAGYGFMSAGGDPKHISTAWAKIYQTIIGLFVAAASVTIASIIGYIIFQDATFLILPRVVTPT